MTGAGVIYVQDRCDGIRRVAFYWRCFGVAAVELLRMIRPYLIIKAELADLAIAHIKAEGRRRVVIERRMRSMMSRKGKKDNARAVASKATMEQPA
jgi:hypothetical protein